MNPDDKSSSAIIAKAATFVRCQILDELRNLIESQKTVSTARLSLFVDKIERGLKTDAVWLRDVAYKLAELEKNEHP